MTETNFNALAIGDSQGPHCGVTELRTSWGTTVQIPEDSEADMCFPFDGRTIRADPDYLRFEWVVE